MSQIYNKNFKIEENQKLNYFFLLKTLVKTSKVITNSLKTLDYATAIPSDTFPCTNNFIVDLKLTRLGNK